MKRNYNDTPENVMSWVIEKDPYKSRNWTTLDTQKGKDQLVNAILTLIDQGAEVKITSDGYALILEANDKELGSYEFIDSDHYVSEIEREDETDE